MTTRRFESGWVGRRGLECLLLAESNVAYRQETVDGEVHLRKVRDSRLARDAPVRVEVALLYENAFGVTWFNSGSIVGSRSLGVVEPPNAGDARILPFNIQMGSDALAQPGRLVARISTGPWPWNILTSASLPMRIGLERTAEDLIYELASLAEARAQVWHSSTGVLRARLLPTRVRARYRSLMLEVDVQAGRAKGTLQVLTSEGPADAYTVDLRLSDRREYREALWKCLSAHLDLSGQFPIPAADSSPSVDQLPRLVDHPSPSLLDVTD